MLGAASTMAEPGIRVAPLQWEHDDTRYRQLRCATTLILQLFCLVFWNVRFLPNTDPSKNLTSQRDSRQPLTHARSAPL
jgi:hypothetical protein